MQRRQHARVRLRLAARLRWPAPLGQRIEECETINASRGGLLVESCQAHGPGQPLWVTFPFDPGTSSVQPEVPARVVRSEERKQRQPQSWTVALQFDGPTVAGNRNGQATDPVKKNGAGKSFALPIRVPLPNVPWHEEAMTFEVAPGKVRFVTNREYAFGERLLISFDSRSDAPWSGDEEWEGEVTGLEMDANSDSVTVTVRRRNGGAVPGA